MVDLSSPEAMRTEFRNLTAQKDAIEADLGPLRVQRDAVTAQYRQDVTVLNAQIKTLSEPLLAIDMQIGALVRALKGKTGRPR